MNLKVGGLSLLTLTACSSTPPPKPMVTQTNSAIYEEGVPGGTVIKTSKLTATVTKIDPATRRVTLLSPNGASSVVKCGPEVVNFNQIHVGDKLKVTATEELVVSMGADDAPGSVGDAALAALAAKGEKPAAALATTTQVTGKIVQMDPANHRVMLAFRDGTVKLVPVREDVDLSQRQIGETVVIRRTEAMAVRVEKP